MKKNLALISLFSLVLGGSFVPILTTTSCAPTPDLEPTKEWYLDENLDKLPQATTTDFLHDPTGDYEMIQTCTLSTNFMIDFQDESWSRTWGLSTLNGGKVSIPEMDTIAILMDPTISKADFSDRGRSFFTTKMGASSFELPYISASAEWSLHRLAILDRFPAVNEIDIRANSLSVFEINEKHPDYELYFESCNFGKITWDYSMPNYSLKHTKKVTLKDTGVEKHTKEELISILGIDPVYADKVEVL